MSHHVRPSGNNINPHCDGVGEHAEWLPKSSLRKADYMSH